MFQNLSKGGGGTGGLKDVDNVTLIVHTASAYLKHAVLLQMC